MIPDKAISKQQVTSVVSFYPPKTRAGCSIEDHQSRALNNLYLLTETISDDEKWLNEIDLERQYDERHKRAGHALPSGPHTRLCYWYFEAKQKRKLS